MNRTKIDALYDLAVKVGGSAKKDDSIVEMIDQITEGYSGGGSGGSNVDFVELTTTFSLPTDTQTMTSLNSHDIGVLNELKGKFEAGNLKSVIFVNKIYNSDTFQWNYYHLLSISNAEGFAFNCFSGYYNNLVGEQGMATYIVAFAEDEGNWIAVMRRGDKTIA